MRAWKTQSTLRNKCSAGAIGHVEPALRGLSPRVLGTGENHEVDWRQPDAKSKKNPPAAVCGLPGDEG